VWVEHTRAGCPSERGPSLKGTPLSPRGPGLGLFKHYLVNPSHGVM
jgi:hypothetical protein